MTTREKILAEIKQNKPAELPLPVVDIMVTEADDVVAKYLQTINGIGGKGLLVEGLSQVSELLNQRRQSGLEIVNGVQGLEGVNIEEYRGKDAAAVDNVDTVFIQGSLAVAENGAVWVPEKNMVNRLLPFICQHLVLVVNENDVVDNMHVAYKRLQVNEDGYGAFIAGPSKTADIEQSLVIGAHGPLSLHVFVLKS